MKRLSRRSMIRLAQRVSRSAQFPFRNGCKAQLTRAAADSATRLLLPRQGNAAAVWASRLLFTVLVRSPQWEIGLITVAYAVIE